LLAGILGNGGTVGGIVLHGDDGSQFLVVQHDIIIHLASDEFFPVVNEILAALDGDYVDIRGES
jgi:hypothetical protein